MKKQGYNSRLDESLGARNGKTLSLKKLKVNQKRNNGKSIHMAWD